MGNKQYEEEVHLAIKIYKYRYLLESTTTSILYTTSATLYRLKNTSTLECKLKNILRSTTLHCYQMKSSVRENDVDSSSCSDMLVDDDNKS